MRNSTKLVVAAALASVAGCAALRGQTRGSDPNNPMGKCFGVVGKNQGDCGGKDAVTGETWGCSNSNTTADNGWKKMSKDLCERTTKHPDATKKYFEPFPA